MHGWNNDQACRLARHILLRCKQRRRGGCRGGCGFRVRLELACPFRGRLGWQRRRSGGQGLSRRRQRWRVGRGSRWGCRGQARRRQRRGCRCRLGRRGRGRRGKGVGHGRGQRGLCPGLARFHESLGRCSWPRRQSLAVDPVHGRRRPGAGWLRAGDRRAACSLRHGARLAWQNGSGGHRRAEAGRGRGGPPRCCGDAGPGLLRRHLWRQAAPRVRHAGWPGWQGNGRCRRAHGRCGRGGRSRHLQAG